MNLENQKMSNQGDHRKYFTMMLNMAEDDLDPYEYRLLAHYVRWSGSGEPHEEGIRHTAKKTKMSVNKLRKARAALVTAGYITLIEPTKEEQEKGAAIVVTVLDRWAENVQRYSKSVSIGTQGGVSNNTQGSKGEGVSEMTQGGVSNMTPMKNSNTEEPKKEKQTPAPTDAAQSSKPTKKRASKKPAALHAELVTPVKTAIVDAFIKYGVWDKASVGHGEWGKAGKAATTLCNREVPVQPDEIDSLIAFSKQHTSAKSWAAFSPLYLDGMVANWRRIYPARVMTTAEVDKAIYSSNPNIPRLSAKPTVPVATNSVPLFPAKRKEFAS